MRFIISMMIGGFFMISPLLTQNLQAQSTESAEDVIKEVTARERVVVNSSLNDYETTVWMRDVYRVISINDDANAAFFYPMVSDANQANLFSLLFNLIKDNAIEAYRFNLQNSGVNDDLETVGFRGFLDAYSIPYAVNADNTLSVNSYDIPSDEILGYYVKEKWFFDSKTGKGDVRIAAICPVLHREGSYGSNSSNVLRSPLFWVSFDEITPYLLRAENSTSISDITKLSNKLSMFDILRKRYYKGEIYQIGDRTLVKYFPTPELLSQEQDRLEKELAAIQTRFSKIK